MIVHVDLDGVIFDFDRAATAALGINPRKYEEMYGSKLYWNELHRLPNFYLDLPLMPDAHELIDGIKALGCEFVFNSGTPKSHRERVTVQKAAAVAEHFPGVTAYFGPSRNKRDYAQPGDIIIDDWPQYRYLWEEVGGIWISHTSAKDSLEELTLILLEKMVARKTQ